MIVQHLCELYERDVERDRAMPYGYSAERIRWHLIIDLMGDVVAVEDMADSKLIKRVRMPESPGGTGNIAPRTLHGNCSYVLGAMTDKQIKEEKAKRCEDEHAAWIKHHRDLLAGTDDDVLQAVLAFCASWSSEKFDALPYAAELRKGDFLALRYDGPDGPELISDRPSFAVLWADYKRGADEAAAADICAVYGETLPIATKHPQVPIGGSTAALSSYNTDSVRHFGLEKSDNAHLSTRATHAYTSALKGMLTDRERNVQIGDATAVFWVDGAGDPQTAEALIAALLTGGTVAADESAESTRLRETLRLLAAGRPLAAADPGLDPGTTFHILAVSPARARLVVRWYLVGTLGEIADRIGEHWQDMALKPLAWRTPPSAQWIALQTTPYRSGKLDQDSLNPTLPGELLHALLTGSRYPHGLLQSLIMRLGTDGEVTPLRVAIIKACLARDARLSQSEERIPMALDPDNPSAAYQLGRLFAMLENVYGLANPGSERSLADGSYRLASAQPGAAFPRLLSTTQHHLASMRRANKGGLAHTINQEIGAVTSRLGAEFPSRLSMSDQGRFALGYYQQRSYRRPKSETTETEIQEG